jgi:hypothetical protein
MQRKGPLLVKVTAPSVISGRGEYLVAAADAFAAVSAATVAVTASTAAAETEMIGVVPRDSKHESIPNSKHESIPIRQYKFCHSTIEPAVNTVNETTVHCWLEPVRFAGQAVDRLKGPRSVPFIRNGENWTRSFVLIKELHFKLRCINWVDEGSEVSLDVR